MAKKRWGATAIAMATASLVGGCGGGSTDASTTAAGTTLDVVALESALKADTGAPAVNCGAPKQPAKGERFDCLVTTPLGGVTVRVTQENAIATRFYYRGGTSKGGVTLRYDNHLTLP